MNKAGLGGVGNESQEGTVKFSVCAIVDLQGFSSHLEISGYDLRTAIGEQATSRLRNLETAIDCLVSEKARRPEFYPSGLHCQRINDAILIAMDLDDILVPSVGQTAFHGLTAGSLSDFFPPDELDDDKAFEVRYNARLRRATEPLEHFLGLVARIHLFVQSREGASFYPGTKTVVATGFRKPFVSSTHKEDFLSANFALANATTAEKALRGPHFFVDNNVLEILSRSAFARNLLRLAHFDWQEAEFDCLSDDGGDHRPIPKPVVLQPIEVVLFRRRYLFKRLSASPLSYLQHLASIAPFLTGSEKPDRSNRYYAHVYDAIKHGLSKRMIQSSAPPQSFVNSSTNDLQVDVVEFREFLAAGSSPTKEARLKSRHLAELGIKDPDKQPELVKKLDELGEQVVTLPDMPTLDISDLGNAVWSLSEEHFAGLLPLLSGDMNALDFPHDPE